MEFQKKKQCNPLVNRALNQMAHQPASGAKDLNPKQVETNHLLSKKLTEVYRLWGYEEISPPRVERLSTLMAGGAIRSEDIVQLVADDPLGLRPELTASITRAACTRLAQRNRPLRLSTTGTIFEIRDSVEGAICIEENLQCGVELFGYKGINAEIELLTLLLQAMEKLDLDSQHEPTLLIGHTSLMQLILSDMDIDIKDDIKNALLNYDRLTLENLDVDKKSKDRLLEIQSFRGHPTEIINKLSNYIGESHALENLQKLFSTIQPIAKERGIKLQLDPTFQPHFELYTGIVFQLVCKGYSAPVVIARGGRYDDLVKHFGAIKDDAAGLGFSFAIDKIREFIIEKGNINTQTDKIIIAYGQNTNINAAFERQLYWHNKGHVAEIQLDPVKSKEDALLKVTSSNNNKLDWIE